DGPRATYRPRRSHELLDSPTIQDSTCYLRGRRSVRPEKHLPSSRSARLKLRAARELVISNSRRTNGAALAICAIAIGYTSYLSAERRILNCSESRTRS